MKLSNPSNLTRALIFRRIHSRLALLSGVCVNVFVSAVSVNAAAVVSTWSNPASGNWNTASNWTNAPALGGAPNNGNGAVATYDAVINATGAAYTVTLNTSATIEHLTINSANATLTQTAGTFTANTGLDVGPGRLRLNGGTMSNTALQVGTAGSLIFSGGTLKNSVVSGTGTASIPTTGNAYGTLDGVTLGINLSVVDSTLGIRNGLVLANNANVTLSGTLLTHISFLNGTQAVSGSGQILLADTGGGNAALDLRGDGTQAGASVVTLGPGISFRALRNTDIVALGALDRLINQGTISVDGSGKTLTIGGGLGNFINEGTLSAPTGTLTVHGTNWSGNGSKLAVSGTGVLNLGGSFSFPGAASFTRSGGTVNLVGILDNSGGAFALNANTGSWNLVGGTVKGGTLSTADGSALVLSGSNNGTFDGLTLASDFAVGGRSLIVRNGLTLTNNAKVIIGTPTGPAAELSFSGSSQALAGTGEIVFAQTGATNRLTLDNSNSPGGSSVLTIGAGITVHGSGAAIISTIGTASTVNYGRIIADAPDAAMTVSGPLTNFGTLAASSGQLTIISESWNNSGGTLAVSGTGVLTLGGTFSSANLGAFNRSGGTVNLAGRLDNTGRTLALDATTGAWNLAHGATIVGGTVTGADGAALTISENNGPALQGVALGVDLTNNGGALNITNGLTLLRNAKIHLGNNGAFYSILRFNRNAQFLGGDGEVMFDGSNSRNYITVSGGGSPATAASLTIESGVVVHGSQDGTIESVFSSDSVINKGTISADSNGKSITITAGFLNSGTLEAKNGGTLNIPAGFTQTDGMVKVGSGSSITVSAGKTIDIAGGTLTGSGTITANVTNAGSVSPGSSPGTLTINGDLTLGLTSDLQIEISGTTQGTQFDLLSESGTVPLTLAGTLSVKFLNGFLAAPGDAFVIIASNQPIAGDFSNLFGGRVATIDGSGTFAVTRSGNTVTLSNFAVPEPATFALCAMGLAVLSGRRRK